MTKNEKVIGAIGALALILSLVGLVGNQSVSDAVSDEQIVQIAQQVAEKVLNQTLGGGTRMPSGISADTT